jgi:predicted extracellular nuclease
MRSQWLLFVQDANEPWSGIKVYEKNRQVAEGDSVTVTGKVAEYYGLTEITKHNRFRSGKRGRFRHRTDGGHHGEIATVVAWQRL